MTRQLFDALGEVAGRLARAPGVFLGSDFDGTLCPLTDRPEDALLPVAARRILAALAERRHVAVAIVGGRERNDLQARVGVPGIVYAGNHGLDISGPGLVFIEPTAAGQSQALHRLAAELEERLAAVPGAAVEDRGLTLNVYFRRVEPAQVEEVRRIVHGVLAATDLPFRLTSGDRSFAVRPRVDWNKGSALRWIKEQVSSPDALAIYLGDGTTDEEVFATLEDGVTVRVGSPEGTAAHYAVDDPAGAFAFLEWLNRHVQ